MKKMKILNMDSTMKRKAVSMILLVGHTCLEVADLIDETKKLVDSKKKPDFDGVFDDIEEHVDY